MTSNHDGQPGGNGLLLGVGAQVDDFLGRELVVTAPAALPFVDHLLRMRRHDPSVLRPCHGLQLLQVASVV